MFDILLFRETVVQEIFAFDHQQRFCGRHLLFQDTVDQAILCSIFLLVRETVDQEIFVFNALRHLTEMICVIERRFC